MTAPRILPALLGAIAGDIAGSRFEARPTKSREFELDHERCRYTDDTVLTVATAKAILESRGEASGGENLAGPPRADTSRPGGDAPGKGAPDEENPAYAEAYKAFGRRNPHRGFGGNFSRWLNSESMEPYGSFGNGSAMRVSPVGCAFSSREEVLEQAKRSARVTHNHPEGIKGAQAVAYLVWRCRSDSGVSPGELEMEITAHFGYELDRSLDAIRKDYRFDVTCQGSVPEAIIAFLEATSVEDAIRNAVSLGGDSDTQACIAGAIAGARFGGVSEEIEGMVNRHLPEKYLSILRTFSELFPRSP